MTRPSRCTRFTISITILLSLGLLAWDPLPVKDDPVVFMPGTQPGAVTNLESVQKCDNCHGGYDQTAPSPSTTGEAP